MKDIFQMIDFLLHFYAKNLQNSDEMDNFLAKYSLSKIDLSRNRKLTHTDFQKRKKTEKKKNTKEPPWKKVPHLSLVKESFTGEFSQNLLETGALVLHILFQSTENERKLPNTFYKQV